jgi:hypothetical protein
VVFNANSVRNGTVTCRTLGNFAERQLSDFRYFRIRLVWKREAEAYFVEMIWQVS